MPFWRIIYKKKKRYKLNKSYDNRLFCEVFNLVPLAFKEVERIINNKPNSNYPITPKVISISLSFCNGKHAYYHHQWIMLNKA